MICQQPQLEKPGRTRRLIMLFVRLKRLPRQFGLVNVEYNLNEQYMFKTQSHRALKRDEVTKIVNTGDQQILLLGIC